MKTLRNSTMLFIALALLGGAFLAGCSAPTALPEPTLNSETVIAAAVQTLGAQMTQTAASLPTATSTSTSTPEPTATETPVPPTPTADLPTATPTATETSAPAVAAKFLTASTYPENKLAYTSNERFSVSVRFMNTGTVSWEPGSILQLSGSEGEVTVQPQAIVERAIAPGEVIEFDIWAFGSETKGKHTWYFQLSTATGIPIPGGFAAFSYDSVD